MKTTKEIITTALRPAILAEVKRNRFAKDAEKIATEATDSAVINLSNVIDRALRGEFPVAGLVKGLRKRMVEFKVKDADLEALVVSLEKVKPR